MFIRTNWPECTASRILGIHERDTMKQLTLQKTNKNNKNHSNKHQTKKNQKVNELQRVSFYILV